MKLIGDIAELSGVSIRMLRYYDEVGLLKPQARSHAGYRLYGGEDLLRLREILVWRKLEFPLADIAALLDDPSHDRGEALRRQLEIARSQLGKFRGIARGLELALAAFDAGRALAEDDVFAGFTLSLADDDDSVEPAAGHRSSKGAPTDRIAQGPSVCLEGGGYCGDAEHAARRIVGTDPIRVAESLLALGILPVGTGTYEGRFTEEPGEWTWPPFVEPAVRQWISDVGYYGSDASRVGSLAPDAIIDLTSRYDPHVSYAEHISKGRYSYHDFSSIAPTRLIPIKPPSDERLPAFRHYLVEVAAAIDRTNLAEHLLAIWEGRIRALRAHVIGRDVGVVGTWGPGSIWGDDLYVPAEEHYCQAFSSLGLNIAVPDDSERGRAPGYAFEVGQIADLDVDTLFFHTRHLRRERVDALLRSESVAGLPATRYGRIFELGWEFVNSGWFGANWQLHVIAHAFGLIQLKAGEGADLVLAVVDPASGVIELTSAFRSVDVSLSGPDLRATSASLKTDEVTRLCVSQDVVHNLCGLPEAYFLSISDGFASTPFTHDRESALDRLSRQPTLVHAGIAH